jgi:hypothetical protein
MKMKRYLFLILLALIPISCSKPSSGIPIGAKLYDTNGQIWGTVVDSSASHTFENGVTEPGVQVDYGPRMGNPPVPPVWIPARSAQRYKIE